MSTTTLSRVRPCALWMVTAHASLRGSCSREHWVVDDDHVRRSGMIGTVPSESVGPEYVSNVTVTATGKSGGAAPTR